MKATLRRLDGRPRLELDAENPIERKLLQRFIEMLNDNRPPLRGDDAAFDTPLRVESFGVHQDTLIEAIAIETAFEWAFRKAPKK